VISSYWLEDAQIYILIRSWERRTSPIRAVPPNRSAGQIE